MNITCSGKQTEAIIFDFDGVIVDTEPLHYKAFQKTLEPFGLLFSWDEYVDTYIGFDDRDAFRHAFSSNTIKLDTVLLSRMIEQKAAHFQEITSSGVSAYPGVVQLILKLNTKGIPLAICSGALRRDIDPILTQLGISNSFDVIVTADDVAASKPDPECYELTFQRLQCARNNCFSKTTTLVLEDTPAGISSAKAAGLMVCAITNSYPANKLIQADFAIGSLETLL